MLESSGFSVYNLCHLHIITLLPLLFHFGYFFLFLSACCVQDFTSWQIDGETIETVTDFIFLGSRITADGDYSNEIKRHLLFGRKAMTNLDSILKNRDIILAKVHLVITMVFPVVMYRY